MGSTQRADIAKVKDERVEKCRESRRDTLDREHPREIRRQAGVKAGTLGYKIGEKMLRIHLVASSHQDFANSFSARNLQPTRVRKAGLG